MFYFVILLLPYYFLGQCLNVGITMCFNTVSNLLVADMLTNIHSFIIVVNNHTGNDMSRFLSHCCPFSGSLYLCQMLAFANFYTGSGISNFFHGYLNYQIEYHLWPNLSIWSYQKAAPLVREICKEHGVPHAQKMHFWEHRRLVRLWLALKVWRGFLQRMKGLETDQKAKELVKH